MHLFEAALVPAFRANADPSGGPKRRATNKFDSMQAAFSSDGIPSLLLECQKDKTRNNPIWRKT
jgi:hypothetical protein